MDMLAKWEQDITKSLNIETMPQLSLLEKKSINLVTVLLSLQYSS